MLAFTSNIKNTLCIEKMHGNLPIDHFGMMNSLPKARERFQWSTANKDIRNGANPIMHARLFGALRQRGDLL